MQRIVVLIVSSVAAIACTSAAPPAATSSANSPERAAENTAPAASNDDVITVSDVPSVPSAGNTPVREEVICENVRRTGSHRTTRICRTRSEIERSADAGKDTFDKLHQSQRVQPQP